MASPPYRYAMFTKHLQSLPLPEAAKLIHGLDFQGADLTVRPSGFVDPTKVATDLPPAIGICHDAGLEVPLLTTGITSASDPVAAPTFEAASQSNVPEIKLGYIKYDTFGTYQKLLDQTARDLDGLEKLAKRTQVRANLHIHSEGTLTALAPIVWWLIKDRDPTAIGGYVDPGHMLVEGGGEGWRMSLDLLQSRIALVAIKDLTWEHPGDPSQPKRRWLSKMVPLQTGMVPWPQFFDCLRHVHYTGWLSFHSEYQGPRSWKNLTLNELAAQTREDLAYIRSIVANS